MAPGRSVNLQRLRVRRKSTRNHKVSSRMHHGIKIYKYSGALTRITCTGARSSIRLNGSNKLSAIYVAYMPPVSFTL